MSARAGRALLVASALGLVAPAVAEAGEGEGASPEQLEAPESRPLIAAGEPVVPCGWPTTVIVSGGVECSGALVHPELVIYAAHCGGGTKTIRFGESALAPARSVATSGCRANPNYAGPEDQGRDWAYCRLAEAVTDLPVTPPLFGCETEELAVGGEVALVGYGDTLDAPGDLKHWAATSLVAVTPGNNTALVGDPDLAEVPSICTGDSGGPGLISLGSEGWRVYGIASTLVGECGGYGAHALVPAAVSWIERDSDLDITPCHAADGSWAPGPDCGGFLAAAPNTGSGAWDDWCAGTPASEVSRSCGPAWDEFDPTQLPTVAIAAPIQGDTFAFGTQLQVFVEGSKHPEGYAIAEVELGLVVSEDLIEPLAVDRNDPWVFEELSFAEPGVYELVAIARDWADNEVRSEVVEITYGVDSGEEGGSEDTGPAPPGGAEEGEATGCACTTGSTPRAPARAAFVLGLVLIGLGRHRRTRAWNNH